MKSGKQLRVEEYTGWWHSIDCGDGVFTQGIKTIELLRQEIDYMQIPSLIGKTVLDIGAYDGFFSFHAEEKGASKVVALDQPGMWSPYAPNGRRGFEIVHELKNSKVQQRIDNFMTADLFSIGQFDIVFFLGVIYHLEEPLTALKRLSALTREMAIIETHAIYVPEYEDHAFLEFYENDRLNNDSTNQFGFNSMALMSLCRQVGFHKFKITSPYPPVVDRSSSLGHRSFYRLTMQAFK